MSGRNFKLLEFWHENSNFSSKNVNLEFTILLILYKNSDLFVETFDRLNFRFNFLISSNCHSSHLWHSFFHVCCIAQHQKKWAQFGWKMQIGQFCQQGMSSLASCLQKRLEMRVWDENVFNLFQLMQNSFKKQSN